MTVWRLTRVADRGVATLGVLVTPELEIPTLELPWRNNLQQVSAVPTGSYVFRPIVHQRFKSCFEVLGVPGRSGILIHAGNVATDTHGCIIVGMRFGRLHGAPAVLESREAMKALRESWKKGEGVLHITAA